jgi:2-(1,2-epoxy-1,2-dihydrophenyl)acetyl-CoA isomerase
MSFETILLDVADGIATLTFNLPESRNGLTTPLANDLTAALKELAARDDVRALILTGAGQSFCAGANLSGKSDPSVSAGERGAKTMEELYNPMILALQNFPLPIVSAVNGAAAGAGVSIALAADVVVAGRSAFFLMPFLPKLGIVPDLGATWFVPEHIGRARALGLTLLGDRLPAEKAEQWGLIWSCVDDAVLLEEARKYATRLAKNPPHAALEARRALDKAREQNLASQLSYEAARQRELLDLPSFKEGVQAFFEKRDPVFRK